MFPFSYLTSSSTMTTLHCSPQLSRIPTSTGNVSIAEFVQKYCPALFSGFKPSWWLPNGHAQTAYCVMGDFSQIDQVTYQRKYIRLPDGGTLGIDFTPPLDEISDPTIPIVVVGHGLTGGSHESYVRHILATACAPKDKGGLGYRGAVINFRGCAGVPLTSPRFYSAACSDDYACGALYISKLFPEAKLVGLGFSLGANVITRYLGEEGSLSRLVGGCVLACPWNLVSNSIQLEGTWLNRTIYSPAMGQNLLKLYKSHLGTLEKFEGSVLMEIHPKIMQLKKPRLIEIDELLVCKTGGSAPIWPLPCANDYYKYASSDQKLPGIQVPYLAINAGDDPIVPVIPRPDEPSCEASGWVAVAITPGGGHLGWFEDGEKRGEVRRWIREPVLQWLRAVIEEYKPEKKPEGRPIEEVDGFVREVGREDIGYREIDEADLPRGPDVKGLTKGL
ncbi:AB-hydrolase YheT [Serendipita vermifera]|nr:AB-hydrolase YheT [Serendipita vermifera]